MREMSEDRLESLRTFNEETSDWQALCPQCGEWVKGTLAMLRAGCPSCGKRS